LDACDASIQTACENPDDDFYVTKQVAGGTLYNQLVECKTAVDTYR